MKYYERKTYDVLVAGGGPSGVPAAVAAAREGADVLLVERFGFLGGMATAGLVNPWMPFHDSSEKGPMRGKPIITGIMTEIDRRLAAKGGLVGRTFDPEILKIVLQEMIEESGVSLLLHAVICGAEVIGSKSRRRVRAAQAAVKAGVLSLKARFFIDCTGDADLAAVAGARCEKGRRSDGRSQPCTLNFRVGGVDIARFKAFSKGERAAHPGEGLGARLLRRWRREKRTTCPRENLLIFDTTLPGVLHFNQTRVVKVDATKVVDLARAQVEGTRQVSELIGLLRREIPGFGKVFLLAMAPQIGVRESRRVIGDYLLTEEDVLGGAKFADGVVRGNYPLDIHSPTGAGTVIKWLRPGTSYEIPYRCLTPRGFDNLLVAGRPISATHEAHSSLRIMPICIGLGQAAGTAAAMAVAKGVGSRGVEADALRAILAKRGCNLGRERGSAAPIPAGGRRARRRR